MCGLRPKTPIWRNSAANSSANSRNFWPGAQGVRVVGDRFVFSSEVLFNPGSADLAPEGQAQIAEVVKILDEMAGKIPPGIDWIIRVDGHTDNVPLSGAGEFKDNWQLSQARALSVVRYHAGQSWLSAAALGGDRVWRISARGRRRQPAGAGAEPADRVEADRTVMPAWTWSAFEINGLGDVHSA